MRIFYKATEKQSLADRNQLFITYGVPTLEKSGFAISPFKTSWHGEYDKSFQGYIYYFSRLSHNGNLEMIDVYISRGDCWIKIFLNIFKPSPPLKQLSQLSNNDGLSFRTPPMSTTKWQLRNDEYKGPPFFYMLFMPEHKLGSHFTKRGYEMALNKLENLIKTDMQNIDAFVSKWDKKYTPFETDWEGNENRSK